MALLNAASLATAELCTNHIKTFFSLKLKPTQGKTDFNLGVKIHIGTH